MAKWTELKSGDRVVWERTDGVKFLGTVQGVSLHEVDIELDRSLRPARGWLFGTKTVNRRAPVEFGYPRRTSDAAKRRKVSLEGQQNGD